MRERALLRDDAYDVDTMREERQQRELPTAAARTAALLLLLPHSTER